MNALNTSDFLNPMRTQTWSNGRHVVRCVKVIPETHDVTTFVFNMFEPVLFFFKPGQFVTLELEIDGEKVMRSYTISSAPSLPYSFSITVKRIPNGRVSGWLHKNLKAGDQIAVHGPVGQFNCLDFPTKKALFLSGGVGITPVMSMARWWFDTDSDVDMVFAHSARTPKDIVYAHELNYMSTRIDNFRLHLICEKSEVGEVWGGYRGYLNPHMIKLIAPDFLEREVYCCGPEPYMRAVREMLTALGFDMAHYHEESFGATPAPVAREAKDHATAAAIKDSLPKEMIQLRIPELSITSEVVAGLTLLESAAQAGVNIPKACGLGICGTCRVRVLSGEGFEMNHNGGITEEEIENGYVLSCCTKLRESIEIEL